MDTKEALIQVRKLPAQTNVEIVRGLNVRRTKRGITVARLHYTADPARDPEINPEWKKAERRTYTSEAHWQREQEIVDAAGGGELVFADTLITYRKAIVITDPTWRPLSTWKVCGGFDHGKTNPTALERAYIDHDGNIYFCGEYYMPGREIFEHAPEILKMPDLARMEACMADPSIFPETMQQSQSTGPSKPAPERAKSTNTLYCDSGVRFLAQFYGDRSDVSFAGRLMQHWSNLDQRKPSVFIVCRNYSESPQYGLHPWDCPNLLWELMNARRVKLSATQLASKNPAEALVDKDNHARDAMKYLVMSLPEPAVKNTKQIIAERLANQDLDPTSAHIRAAQYQADLEASNQPATFGTRLRRR